MVKWLATDWTVRVPVIQAIIPLIWTSARADYNQCSIGADDMRASDEGTR